MGLVGCSADSSSIVMKQIDVSGGTLTANGITVEIPAGALSKSVTVTGTSSATSASNAIGPAFVLGPEGQTFAMPVRVTVPFVMAQLTAKGLTTADVEVETAPQGTTQFTSLGGSLVDATHVATTTMHFSIFVATAGGDVDGGTCAPLNSSCASTPCCNGNCDANHLCTTPVCAGAGSACSSNSACCSGSCNGGVCGTAGCVTGETLCGGACVSTSSDSQNCGGCGKVCATTQTCKQGVCG
jgi:hypothetical protein